MTDPLPSLEMVVPAGTGILTAGPGGPGGPSLPFSPGEPCREESRVIFGGVDTWSIGDFPAGGGFTHNGAREASFSRESSQSRGTILPWEASRTRIPLQGQGKTHITGITTG